MHGITIGQSHELNGLVFFYNLLICLTYMTGDYRLDPSHHTNTFFNLAYNGGYLLVCTAPTPTQRLSHTLQAPGSHFTTASHLPSIKGTVNHVSLLEPVIHTQYQLVCYSPQ